MIDIKRPLCGKLTDSRFREPGIFEYELSIQDYTTITLGEIFVGDKGFDVSKLIKMTEINDRDCLICE